MTEKRERIRGAEFRRQRSRDINSSGLATPEFPETSKIGIKTIAFLHAYCREGPDEIVARWPRLLSLGDVHAALSYYYRSREEYDAVIKAELGFNSRTGLETSSVGLPKVGLSALLDVA